MRQAGVVAAAALYALDHHVARLAEDHARARALADGLAAAGLPVDPDATETNFIAIDVGSMGLETVEAVQRVAGEDVLVSTLRPGVLRAVTYLGISDEDVEHAVEAVPRAIGALARV
jgi:threonine aldolase